jgi:hypothetical protein
LVSSRMVHKLGMKVVGHELSLVSTPFWDQSGLECR